MLPQGAVMYCISVSCHIEAAELAHPCGTSYVTLHPCLGPGHGMGKGGRVYCRLYVPE